MVADAGSAEIAAALLEPFAADQIVIQEQIGDPLGKRRKHEIAERFGPRHQIVAREFAAER